MFSAFPLLTADCSGMHHGREHCVLSFRNWQKRTVWQLSITSILPRKSFNVQLSKGHQWPFGRWTYNIVRIWIQFMFTSVQGSSMTSRQEILKIDIFCEIIRPVTQKKIPKKENTAGSIHLVVWWDAIRLIFSTLFQHALVLRRRH
jgi:hypothetical protein